MEHPLIGDISDQTMEDLATRISDLQKKLTIAQRSGNGHLANQVRMALETYQNQYQSRLRASQPSGNDYNDRIKIE